MPYTTRVSFRVFSPHAEDPHLGQLRIADAEFEKARGQPDRWVWTVGSSLATEAPLAHHLEHLLDALEPHADLLTKASATERSFLCTIFEDEAEVNLSLHPGLLVRIARLDATLHLSVWAGLEDELEASPDGGEVS